MQEINLEKLRNILRTVFEIEPFENVDLLEQQHSCLWDSIAKITIVVAIESEFNVSIATQEYGLITSFDSIKNMLEKRGF